MEGEATEEGFPQAPWTQAAVIHSATGVANGLRCSYRRWRQRQPQSGGSDALRVALTQAAAAGIANRRIPAAIRRREGYPGSAAEPGAAGALPVHAQRGSGSDLPQRGRLAQ